MEVQIYKLKWWEKALCGIIFLGVDAAVIWVLLAWAGLI